MGPSLTRQYLGQPLAYVLSIGARTFREGGLSPPSPYGFTTVDRDIGNIFPYGIMGSQLIFLTYSIGSIRTEQGYQRQLIS